MKVSINKMGFDKQYKIIGSVKNWILVYKEQQTVNSQTTETYMNLHIKPIVLNDKKNNTTI